MFVSLFHLFVSVCIEQYFIDMIEIIVVITRKLTHSLF